MDGITRGPFLLLALLLVIIGIVRLVSSLTDIMGLAFVAGGILVAIVGVLAD